MARLSLDYLRMEAPKRKSGYQGFPEIEHRVFLFLRVRQGGAGIIRVRAP
jgi:hypothetical protein